MRFYFNRKRRSAQKPHPAPTGEMPPQGIAKPYPSSGPHNIPRPRTGPTRIQRPRIRHANPRDQQSYQGYQHPNAGKR